MRSRLPLPASRILFFSVATSPVAAQEAHDGFAPRWFTGATGSTMPYRLFVPPASARAHPLPLIIYLHGGGGAGTDNVKQIAGGNTNGTHLWLRPGVQTQHPAFVVAPQ